MKQFKLFFIAIAEIIQSIVLLKIIIDVRKTYVIIKIEVIFMKSIKATNARKQIYKLIEETVNTNTPIQISSKNGNVIMISEADWNSIQETLYLISIPGIRESIIEGLNTPIEDCVEELNWDTK